MDAALNGACDIGKVVEFKSIVQTDSEIGIKRIAETWACAEEIGGERLAREEIVVMAVAVIDESQELQAIFYGAIAQGRDHGKRRRAQFEIRHEGGIHAELSLIVAADCIVAADAELFARKEILRSELASQPKGYQSFPGESVEAAERRLAVDIFIFGARS